MKNVYIYCEGPTEETFVNEILYPYFLNIGIIVCPIICTTKRTIEQKFKGGVSDYYKIKNELTKICRSHKNEYVTTMFDYYAMPSNTPDIDCSIPNVYERIHKIENSINDDIGEPNFKFNFMLHEFEGILFSEPDSFNLIANSDVVENIKAIRCQFATPEEINNSPETAPSKRLLHLMPGYAKVKNGAIIAKKTGIDRIMEECPHFRNWIKMIIDFT